MSFSHTDLPTLRDMCERAAQDVVTTLAAKQASGGEAHLVLTGGTAGIETCRQLLALHQAAEQQRESFPIDAINWETTHVYFGDERNVPVADPESNEGQAREALLNHVPIPESNIHSFGLDGTEDSAYLTNKATEYEALLPERFDVHLFGVGPDGHVNSLFPSHAALVEEDWLVTFVTDSPKPPAQRLTLTFPAVARADKAILLISGKAKAAAFAAVDAGKPAIECPAAEVTRRTNATVFTSERG